MELLRWMSDDFTSKLWQNFPCLLRGMSRSIVVVGKDPLVKVAWVFCVKSVTNFSNHNHKMFSFFGSPESQPTRFLGNRGKLSWWNHFHLLVAIALLVLRLQDHTVFLIPFRFFQGMLQDLDPTWWKLTALLLSAADRGTMVLVLVEQRSAPLSVTLCKLNKLRYCFLF